MREYQVLVIMKDIPGVLSKISGLFSKRGFNINGITSGVSERDGFFRMTISVIGNKKIIEQIKKQVGKLVDVVEVQIFDKARTIKRELILVKIKTDFKTRSELIEVADIFKGKIIDISHESLIIELIGDLDKIDGFLKLVQKFEVLEISRTGITAMHRGEKQ